MKLRTMAVMVLELCRALRNGLRPHTRHARAGRRRGRCIGRYAVTQTALALAVIMGCSVPGSSPRVDRPEVLFADGFLLELQLQGLDNYAALYRVNGARRLGFGGGVPATQGQLTWTGSLSLEQYDRLQALLRQHGWFDADVASTGEPPQQVARIALRWPGGRRRFKVTGDSPDVDPVRQLLDDAARLRLQPALGIFPQPGERR